MKKSILGLAALALLASCNNDEELNSLPPEAITFGNPFVDNATRAIDPSYGTGNPIQSFFVYGTVENVNIFDGETVSGGTVGTDVAWSCTGKAQYWIAGADYIFDAVVGVEEDDITTDGTTGLPTKLSYAMADQNDMLYQRVTTEGKPTTHNGLVAFTFTHLLSKINFIFKNESPAKAVDYSYRIDNLKLTNVYTSADYKVDGTWENTKIGDYTLTLSGAVASQGQKDLAREILLVPGASIGVSFNLVTICRGTDIKTESIAKTAVLTPQANYSYNLIVTKSLTDPIQFTVEKNPTWTGGSGVDVE